MRKGTELLVVTRRVGLEIRRAEFGLVLVGVVEFFNAIVRQVAIIFIRTILGDGRVAPGFLSGIWTDIRLVSTQLSASVLVHIVVVWAALNVMVFVVEEVNLTGLSFKTVQIQKEHAGRLPQSSRVEIGSWRLSTLRRRLRLLWAVGAKSSADADP